MSFVDVFRDAQSVQVTWAYRAVVGTVIAPASVKSGDGCPRCGSWQMVMVFDETCCTVQGSAPAFNNVGNPLVPAPGAAQPGANLGGHLDPGIGADYLLGQDQARLMASVSNSPGELQALP